MKITYEKHYNYLISKYGKEEGEKKYKSFLRSSSLETYIIKYGKEEGEKRYKNKKKPGTSLKKMISKYGKEEGEKRYKNWIELTNQSEKSFIRRYGEKEGEKKYNEFRLKCVIKDKYKNDSKSKYNNRKFNTNINYYLDITNGNYNKAVELLKERQCTSSLKKMINKYGKEEGEKRYKRINKLKSITLENFIRLYGDIEGSEKWNNYINRIKYVRSRKYYIDKYGKEEGEKIWNDIQKKKLNKFILNSKIANDFCFRLFNKLKGEIDDEFYFSDNEYLFFINSDYFKIIIPDFYIKNNKIIIEFYGDYWHRNPNIYKDEISEKIRERDYKRIQELEKIGNDVIIVWENDYRENKNKTINNICNIIINKIKNK